MNSIYENERLIDNICISYRHDFVLLDKETQKSIRFKCKEWIRAICGNIRVFESEYILMGIEYNNIWKLPVFYVDEQRGALFAAKDYIEEAAKFSLADAEEKRKYLQKEYPAYTWYLIKLNKQSY